MSPLNPLVNIIGGRIVNAVFDGLLKGKDRYASREERLHHKMDALTELENQMPASPPQAVSQETPAQHSPTDLSGTSQLSAEGKACVPCSADHLSVVAGALSEALRFARSDGIDHPEVLTRVALSFDELNILERIDAAPENIERLPEGEKALMRDVTVTSRNLRHMLSDLKSVEDLEAVTAEAQRARTALRSKLFRLQFAEMRPEDQKRVKERARELVERRFNTEEEDS